MKRWGFVFLLSFQAWALPAEPEAPTGFSEKPIAVGQKHMAASANPYATEAMDWVLSQGGSAVDAAIAAQMVLTLTEPQSSGIGGGLFMVFWDAKAKKLVTLDGRETAPKAATPDLFVRPNGQTARWFEAVVGGRAVGVPGAVAALHKAHGEYGKLPWHTLFEPAIRLAEEGFVVSPRLAGLLARELNPGLKRAGPARDYFYPNGKALVAGEVKRNLELAKTLKLIAQKGPIGFYQGLLAKKMVDAVASDPSWQGLLSLDDFKNYQPKWREPVCAPYRRYQICGMGPPSSGAITVGQILGFMAKQDVAAMEPNGTDFIHHFSQASRLAYADRNYYLADQDFVAVPAKALLSESYLSMRAQWIKPDRDGGNAVAGALPIEHGKDSTQALPSTTHMVAADVDGNLLSLTSSIEMGFGSSVMVGGFLLNNQLTDFSLNPERLGKPAANRVEGGKRPRSSMSPTIVLDAEGQPFLAIGSPGGSRIISYVAQTLIAALDWQLPLTEVMSLPRISHRNDYLVLEKGKAFARSETKLTQMGYRVERRPLNSGVQAIMRTDAGWQGAADPRREGVAIGR